MKETTKAQIDSMSIHELEADEKNARSSLFKGKEKRRYIDERLSLLKSEREETLRESNINNSTDVVDIKPNIFGLGMNLNEVWRRFKKWWSK